MRVRANLAYPARMSRCTSRRALGAAILSLVAGLLAAAGCSDDVALTDARPQIDAAVPGTLMLSWSIRHGDAALTCADVGASTVSIDIVHDGDAFGVVDSFGCTSATGASRMLAPGLYLVRASLAGIGGTLDGPNEIRDLTVPPGGVATVPPITFDVDPTGGLKFRITTATQGNCTAVASGGAGITAMKLELRDATNTCVPATFEVAASASFPAGSYRSDCAGATYACISGDQDVTVTGLRTGTYSMIMTGDVGDATCWRRQPNATVPAAGLVSTLPGQQLALQANVPGCPTP